MICAVCDADFELSYSESEGFDRCQETCPVVGCKASNCENDAGISFC